MQFFDTDCEDLAGCLVSLATMLCSRGVTQHVIITRLVPHFSILCCLLDRSQGNTMQEKTDRYLSMYAAKTDLFNIESKHNPRALERISFWSHNGKCDGDRACVWAKFGRDGIHLSAAGQYQLIRSLRGALTSTANSLSKSQRAQAASMSEDTRSQ